MTDAIQDVEQGTVTSPQGFLAGATYAGIKTYSEEKLDLGLLFSEAPAVAAGMFTTNRIKSPSVVVTQEHIKSGKARAVVVNSGCANACVGDQGYWDAKECTALAAQHLGLDQQEVLVCSTGVIGVELPMALIRTAIPKVTLTRDGGHALALAIMTTDTRPKEHAVAFEYGGHRYTVGGITKGAGMIHPNMATTLSFLATDAPVELSLLKAALKEAVDSTLNMVTIDGDTSTNDSVIILANGAAGGSTLAPGSEGAALFQQALTAVCTSLARQLARDGEGATKVLTITVEGARTLEDARRAARTVVGSSLVKTAVYGNDPNWGRVLASLGASGAEVDERKLALYINDVCIMEEGRPIPFFRDAVIATMQAPEVTFRIQLNLGSAQATAWGCDLTQEYVTVNAAYTT